MNPKKHLQVVFTLTSALLLTAVAIYLSGCKPTFLVGVCSAVRLTRVAFLVFTTLNFLLISTLAYELKIKNFKKSEKTPIVATYLFLLIISVAFALLELKVLTQIRFSPKHQGYSTKTQLSTLA